MSRHIDHDRRNRRLTPDCYREQASAEAGLSTSVSRIEHDFFKAEVRGLLEDPLFVQSYPGVAGRLQEVIDEPEVAYQLPHWKVKLLERAKQLLEFRKRKGDDWDCSRVREYRPNPKRTRAPKEFDMGPKPVKPPGKP